MKERTARKPIETAESKILAASSQLSLQLEQFNGESAQKGASSASLNRNTWGTLPSGLTAVPHPENWVQDEPLPSLSLTRHFYIMS